MNKNTYDRLTKYEKHLKRGYYGSYVFGLYRNDFDELLEIYRQLGGKERLTYTCNNCVLRLLKFIGNQYFNYIPQEEPIVEEPKVEEKPATKKRTVRRKRTTKKKTTTK